MLGAHLGVRGPVTALLIRDGPEIQAFRYNKAVTGPRTPRSRHTLSRKSSGLQFLDVSPNSLAKCIEIVAALKT
jgi:hypothetical protein